METVHEGGISPAATARVARLGRVRGRVEMLVTRVVACGALAAAVLSAGCSVNSLLTSAAGTGGGGGCSGGKGYSFVLACDSNLGITHMCTEYYSNLPASAEIDMTDTSVCSAGDGTVLSGGCPTVNTLGSCSSIATSGSYGEESIVYEYVTPNLTPAEWQSDCAGSGTYAAPGKPPASPPGASGGTCGTKPAGNPTASGGFSFSVETDLNGQPIECTNYFGVSASGTTSIVNAGEGTTSPCPAGTIDAVCDIHGAGPLGGNEYTLIYYSFAGQDGGGIDASGCASQGGTFSTTYSPP
jgi:hypothetical protein